MGGRYIERHNKTVRTIYRAFSNGLKGMGYTVMDASSVDELPAGVSSTRLPSWLLPELAEEDREMMRPDLLIVDGLTWEEIQGLTGKDEEYHQDRREADRHQTGKRQRERRCRIPVPSVHENIKRRCTVHLVEVGFCCEHSFATKLTEKHKQHAKLLKQLQDHGWKVHKDEVTVMLFGQAGTIFQPLDQALTDLGVSNDQITTTMNKIHIDVVKSAQAIVSARRRLERSFVENGRDSAMGGAG